VFININIEKEVPGDKPEASSRNCNHFTVLTSYKQLHSQRNTNNEPGQQKTGDAHML
jgi:hypothetical protein